MYEINIARIKCVGYTVLNKSELPKSVSQYAFPAMDRHGQPDCTFFKTADCRMEKDLGVFGGFWKKYHIKSVTVQDVEQGCYRFTLTVTPVGVNRFWEKSK
jgi:hypothetical protein